MEKSFIDYVIECLAGAASMEIAEAQERILAFLQTQKDAADDPDDPDDWDDWFEAAVDELSDHETLGDDLADVRESIFSRLDITDPDEDQVDEFYEALQQFADVQLQ